MLELAGIRMDIFTPCSTRAASTAKVIDKILLKTLLQMAGWSSCNPFTIFYHKKVQREGLFSVAVLF